MTDLGRVFAWTEQRVQAVGGDQMTRCPGDATVNTARVVRRADDRNAANAGAWTGRSRSCELDETRKGSVARPVRRRAEAEEVHRHEPRRARADKAGVHHAGEAAALAWLRVWSRSRAAEFESPR
jgi:hypothetical protein